MKSVLITGGAVGIGEGLVNGFSNLGYVVYFTYRTHKEEAMELAARTNSTAFYCDITKKMDIQRLKEQLGHIDILINNAGVSDIKICSDISEDEWDCILDTNLKGAFLVSQIFMQSMISAKNGRIINIGSMWGITGASCEVHYSASKAGLIGFTKALAKELAPSNITVNLIAPGLINTNMNKQIDESILNEMMATCPIGRMGTPEDIAHLALFLASDNSSYITGAVIPVDGGYTM